MKISAALFVAYLRIAAVSAQPSDAITYTGPGTVYCGDGSTDDSQGGTCWITSGSGTCDYDAMQGLTGAEPLMGSPVPAVGGIKDFFNIDGQCTVACTECSFQSNADNGCKDDQEYCPPEEKCIKAGAACACVADGGYEWCPATDTCLRSWEEGTPVACGGDPPTFQDYTGPGTLYCGDGTESGAGQCQIAGNMQEACDAKAFEDVSTNVEPMVGNSDGIVAYEGINYFVNIYAGCELKCMGCTFEADQCNSGSTGMTWCPTTSECVRGDCPACVSDGGYTWCAANNQCVRVWEADTPDACKDSSGAIEMGDNTTMAPIGGETDQYGCMPGAGEVWCPELDECIRGFETDCPVEGTDFEGPITISCTGGRCSLPDDCDIDMGGYTVGGPYMSGMDGEYPIPEGCTATCDGCEALVGTPPDMPGGDNHTDAPEPAPTPAEPASDPTDAPEPAPTTEEPPVSDPTEAPSSANAIQQMAAISVLSVVVSMLL